MSAERSTRETLCACTVAVRVCVFVGRITWIFCLTFSVGTRTRHAITSPHEAASESSQPVALPSWKANRLLRRFGTPGCVAVTGCIKLHLGLRHTSTKHKTHRALGSQIVPSFVICAKEERRAGHRASGSGE